MKSEAPKPRNAPSPRQPRGPSPSPHADTARLASPRPDAILPAAGEPGAASDLPLRPAPAPLPGLWLPWQRYVAAFVRAQRARMNPALGTTSARRAAPAPDTAPAPGLYRPLCVSHGCHYNRKGTCAFDRVEPAPAAVMEASVCAHALFLAPGPP